MPMKTKVVWMKDFRNTPNWLAFFSTRITRSTWHKRLCTLLPSHFAITTMSRIPYKNKRKGRTNGTERERLRSATTTKMHHLLSSPAWNERTHRHTDTKKLVRKIKQVPLLHCHASAWDSAQCTQGVWLQLLSIQNVGIRWWINRPGGLRPLCQLEANSPRLSPL